MRFSLAFGGASAYVVGVPTDSTTYTPIAGVSLVGLQDLLVQTERMIAQYADGNRSQYYVRTYTELADGLKTQIAAVEGAA